jgi:hypothetical protein
MKKLGIRILSTALALSILSGTFLSANAEAVGNSGVGEVEIQKYNVTELLVRYNDPAEISATDQRVKLKADVDIKSSKELLSSEDLAALNESA